MDWSDDGRCDRELCLRWQQGDRAAGDRLVRRHIRSLRRYFTRRAWVDPEDLTQRTLTGVVLSIDRFRGECSFRTYLFRVARNTLIDQRRRQMGRGRQNDGPPSDLVIDEWANVAPDGVEARADLSRVLAMLEAIPPADQSLLSSYAGNASASAIASALDISEPAVRSRLRRARARLRAAIANAPRSAATTSTGHQPDLRLGA